MITIYLAGHVPKGDEEAKEYINWRTKYQKILKKIYDAQFIDPYRPDKDESNPKVIVGEDCSHIKQSDLIVINAEDKLGVGTSLEILIAKYFKKPVVVILPRDTYHRRSNVYYNRQLIEDWLHPFVVTFSDFVLEDISEVKDIKDKIFSGQIKDIGIIDEAIKYFNSLKSH